VGAAISERLKTRHRLPMRLNSRGADSDLRCEEAPMPHRLSIAELVVCLAATVSEDIPDVTEWLEDDEGSCPDSPSPPARA